MKEVFALQSHESLVLFLPFCCRTSEIRSCQLGLYMCDFSYLFSWQAFKLPLLALVYALRVSLNALVSWSLLKRTTPTTWRQCHSSHGNGWAPLGVVLHHGSWSSSELCQGTQVLLWIPEVDSWIVSRTSKRSGKRRLWWYKTAEAKDSTKPTFWKLP